MMADEQAVRAVHASWMAAVDDGDLTRLLALMTADVVFLGPGMEPFGRDVFGPHFSGTHEQYRIRCISELEEVIVVGDVAYTRCRDSLRLTPRTGGDSVALAGHRITVYRKQADGRWLLARDAHTLSPLAT